MLVEFENPRQKEKEGYRRIFSDRFFDLYVWYKDSQLTEITGFQLCYDKNSLQEKALTWRRGHGFDHRAVEDFDEPLKNNAPLLIADGLFDFDIIAEKFAHASHEIDPIVAHLVHSKMLEYKKQSFS